MSEIMVNLLQMKMESKAIRSRENYEKKEAEKEAKRKRK